MTTNFILNDGVDLPPIGLGVFQTPPEETRSAVDAALAVGCRHIDTAAGYGNEKQLGQMIAASDDDRSGVFIETKSMVVTNPRGTKPGAWPCTIKHNETR